MHRTLRDTCLSQLVGQGLSHFISKAYNFLFGITRSITFIQKLLSLVASTWHTHLTSRVYSRLADRPSAAHVGTFVEAAGQVCVRFGSLDRCAVGKLSGGSG